MILHIYHCNLAVFRDYASAPGRNRPDGTGRYPDRPGGADISYLPPTHAFGDASLGRLLELFQSIDLADTADSPVRINWQYLVDTLGLTRPEIRQLLQKADLMGLLRHLTIAYDHERWLRHSKEKGCLVVMSGVEEGDLSRDPDECTTAYCDAIDAVTRNVLNHGQQLRDVFVIPNGHLAARAGDGLPWEKTLEVLKGLPPGLTSRGYRAQLNSYGYTKLIQLGINAHKLGYVLRVV